MTLEIGKKYKYCNQEVGYKCIKETETKYILELLDKDFSSDYMTEWHVRKDLKNILKGLKEIESKTHPYTTIFK